MTAALDLLSDLVEAVRQAAPEDLPALLGKLAEAEAVVRGRLSAPPLASRFAKKNCLPKLTNLLISKPLRAAVSHAKQATESSFPPVRGRPNRIIPGLHDAPDWTACSMTEP